MKRLASAALRSLGIELRRISGREPPPPLYEDPDEALHVARGGGGAAIRCPLNLCVQYAGFRYGNAGWHPFVWTLSDGAPDRASDPLARNRIPAGSLPTARVAMDAYATSPLRRYYDVWHPADAAAALIGAVPPPPSLQRLPSHAFLFPWVATTPEERLEAVDSIVRSENARADLVGVGVSEGYNQHGPVTDRKGASEYVRLLRSTSALERGWNRSLGDATATILQRGNERRYLILHGHHRAAAATALGLDAIPVRPGVPDAVSGSEARQWPQVKRGVWTREAAERYFDHLFDFDPADWARCRGLLDNEEASRGEAGVSRRGAAR